MTPVIGFTPRNNGTEESSGKNETIIYNGNALCGGFRQTHIYSGRGSEAEGLVGALQRCFIEFVRLFPFPEPDPSLYLLRLSHKHTHIHARSHGLTHTRLKMMGFSIHPRAQSTPGPD